MKEELKGEITKEMNPDQIVYDVYKTADGLYVSEEICQMYNIGNRNDYKTLREKLCYKIVESDLSTIENQSQYQDIKLVPNIVTIFDLQLVLSFTVYVDKKHNDKLYILNNLCSKYEIYPETKRIIEGTTYGCVTEADLTKIEEATKKESIVLKRKYVDIELEDEIKPAEFLFIYYYDYETRKSYIRREMYELIRDHKIEIEAKPKIIGGKNCYSITENELKKVETQIGYRGVEQLLRPKADLEFPKKEKIEEITEKLKQQQVPVENHHTVETPMTQPQTMEAPETQPPVVEAPVVPKVDDRETILIYKDKRNGQLYVPTNLIDTDAEVVTIMHKPCYKINIYELDKLYRKRIIIANVYPVEKKEYNILICNNSGQLFISKEMLEELGFYIENPHRIMVNKEIYEEITEDDVELIQDKESDSCHINIVVKQITPKRG